MLELVFDDDGATRRMPIRDGLTLGRSSDNDVVLQGLLGLPPPRPGGGDGRVFRILDLDSTNGVKINDTFVTDGVLAAGDRLTIGSFQLPVAGRPRLDDGGLSSATYLRPLVGVQPRLRPRGRASGAVSKEVGLRERVFEILAQVAKTLIQVEELAAGAREGHGRRLRAPAGRPRLHRPVRRRPAAPAPRALPGPGVRVGRRARGADLAHHPRHGDPPEGGAADPRRPGRPALRGRPQHPDPPDPLGDVRAAVASRAGHRRDLRSTRRSTSARSPPPTSTSSPPSPTTPRWRSSGPGSTSRSAPRSSWRATACSATTRRR